MNSMHKYVILLPLLGLPAAMVALNRAFLLRTPSYRSSVTDFTMHGFPLQSVWQE